MDYLSFGMRKTLQSNACCFDELYEEVLLPKFSSITDARGENKSYSQVDALKSGFALYSLKSPSLFSFQQHTKAEAHNMREIYKIETAPSDNGLRKILDKVSSEELREVFSDIVAWTKKNGVLEQFRTKDNRYIMSIDGVQHFKSKSIDCPHCLSRNHADGSRTNYHAMLSAVIVHPDLREVIVADNEPIIKQDGDGKNDCERNAAKRMLENLRKTYEGEEIVFTMDALYACAPIIDLIRLSDSWHYIINVKKDGNKALFRQFIEREADGDIERKVYKSGKEEIILSYANGLSLNDSAKDTRCNLLYCVSKNKKGEQTDFSWVTNLPLNDQNVVEYMRIARSRWKIENEVFNTLKNQNYQFEHNFGHGYENLCTNFAYLMMAAFTIDQLMQLTFKIFGLLLIKLKTKVKLWEFVRSAFKFVACSSMQDLYVHLAEACQVKLVDT